MLVYGYLPKLTLFFIYRHYNFISKMFAMLILGIHCTYMDILDILYSLYIHSLYMHMYRYIQELPYHNIQCGFLTSCWDKLYDVSCVETEHTPCKYCVHIYNNTYPNRAYKKICIFRLVCIIFYKSKKKGKNIRIFLKVSQTVFRTGILYNVFVVYIYIYYNVL